MIRTAYNNRFRDHKGAGSQGRGARQGRREGGSRRESSNVVHPWMSLPERLAAAQAAMRELAGTEAFACPLGESLMPAPAQTSASAPEASNEAKPRNAGVNVVIRKRRLPAGMIASLTGAG